MTFMGEDYLFTAPPKIVRPLYQAIQGLPIIDPHNHVDIGEIVEDRHYTDIWQVEGATDHYIWELMRRRQVDEKYITGNASNKEKWAHLGSVFDDFIGNPVYDWVHLDLARRFGIEGPLDQISGAEIWAQTKAALQTPEFSPRSLLRQMNVEVMCSTDDPLSDLHGHQKLASVADLPKIYPTWRPDQALHLRATNFLDYIAQLSARTQTPIHNIDGLIAALRHTHQFFAQNGCRSSDHGLERPFAHAVSKRQANEIFLLRRAGSALNQAQEADFMAYLLHEFFTWNQARGWVTQLHIGAVRNAREELFTRLGPDAGGDISDHHLDLRSPLQSMLNEFDGRLKVVLYCLDPSHYPTLATLARAFSHNVRLGAPWWFNDSPVGIRDQLDYLSSVDLLKNFAGMVSDSRKIISYGSRMEMFRRILADVLAHFVAQGRVPFSAAERLAKYVCYTGPKEFYGF